jgi:hypothetical protein
MLKNALAIVGFAVMLKTGFDVYCKYRKMEQENELWRNTAKAGD